MGLVPEDGFDADSIARSLMDGSYFAKPKKAPPKQSGLDVPSIVDDELDKLGYPETSRLSILGNLGRENAWNPETIFGGHDDPKNNARNRGLMSWQGDRKAHLENFIATNGGDWTPNENNLRIQTRFLDNELRSKYPKIHNSLTDPGVDTPTASRQLRNYINYVPSAPYNTPDSEYDVKNNRIWAEKAKARGLGQFNANRVAQSVLDGSYFPKQEFDPNSVAESVLDGSYFNDAPTEAAPAPQVAPESPATIAAQAQSAADPNTPRAAVLLNPGETPNARDPQWKGFQAFETKDDHNRFVMVNLAAAKKLGLKDAGHIQNYLKKNPKAFETLGIRVEQVDDTSQGPTVATTAPDGTELNSSIVTSPENAQKQALLDQQNHPGAQSQLVDAEDVMADRIAELQRVGEAAKAGQRFEPDPAAIAELGKVGEAAKAGERYDDGKQEAAKENERQAVISRQKAQAIQTKLKPQAKSKQYDFEKSGEMILPAQMGEVGAQKLKYVKDADIEKNGEYRLSDDEGNDYIYSPTTGKIVDETDTQVLKKIEIPLAEKGTALSMAKETQAGIVADAIAKDYPDIPKQDVVDYFKQKGFSDWQTKLDIPEDRYYQGGFTDPVTGMKSDAKTDFYNFTQRDANRIEAFSQERQQQKSKYAEALRTNLSEGDDDFTADISAKAQAGILSVKTADEILSQKREMRKAAIEALKAEAADYRKLANVPDVEGVSKQYEPTSAEIDAKLKEMTSPENIEASNRIRKMAREIGDTVQSWGLPGQAALGASAAAGSIDALGAAILRPFSGIPGIADIYKEASEKAQARLMAFDIGKDDSWAGFGLRHIPKVAGDLVVLAGLAKVPGLKGRMPLVFATQSAATAAGTGKNIPEIGKAGIEGYLIGKVFEGATAAETATKNAVAGKAFQGFEKRVWNGLSQSEKAEQIALMKTGSSAEQRVALLSNIVGKTVGVAAIAGGTGAVAKASGATNEQTVDQIATNLLFHFGGPLVKTAGKAIGRITRIWKDGKPNDYFLDANEELQKVVKPVDPALVEVEAVVDPENQTYTMPEPKFRTSEGRDVKSAPVTDKTETNGTAPATTEKPAVEVKAVAPKIETEQRTAERRQETAYEGNERREAERRDKAEKLASIRPEQIHNLAEGKDITDAELRDIAKSATGSTELDKMSPEDLWKVNDAIVAREVPPEPVKAEGVAKAAEPLVGEGQLMNTVATDYNRANQDGVSSIERDRFYENYSPQAIEFNALEQRSKGAEPASKLGNGRLFAIPQPNGTYQVVPKFDTLATDATKALVWQHAFSFPESLNTDSKVFVQTPAIADSTGKIIKKGVLSDSSSPQPPKPSVEAAPPAPQAVAGIGGVSKESSPTSTKNRIVETERTERNLSPIEKAAKRDFGTVWDDAAKVLQTDPKAADDLVKVLQSKPRALTDTENALLLNKRIEARTAYDQAARDVNDAFEKDDIAQMEARARLARASDELLDVDRASRQAGTESGRGLNARRMMANEDFTLAALETRKRAANNGRPLTDTERGALQKIAETYKAKSDELEATLAQREEDLAAMRTRAEFAEKRKELARSRPSIERAERVAQRLRETAEADREWLKKRGPVFTAGIDPIVMFRLARIGASHIADVGLDFVKFSDRMITEFGEKIKPHLQDIYDKAKEIAEKVSPGLSEAQRLRAFKTRTEKRITELEEKIKTQDLSKKTRKPLPLDREAGQLQIDVNRLKRNFETELIKDRMKNRSKGEKAQDFVANWARMSFLSWPSTLAKLASAAAQRAIYAPIEEVIGAGYSKVFPKLARQAPSESGFNVRAEAKTYTKGLWEGMKEAGRMLKMQDKNLNLLHGKRDFIPPTGKIDAVMQYFGVLHGALKAPVETMGFTRSLEKRTAHAIKNGADVSDPIVGMELGLAAFADGKRQIFMQDNRVVNAYKSFVRTLEQPKKETGRPSVGGKLAATGLRVTFPVVKIPVNIAGEIVQYATGLASGSVRLAKAYRAGMEKLPPEEADLIMRQLKKGTIGPALMLLGYFSPNAIGGYYQPGQKRDEKDVKFGSIKVFGYNIPSLLLHNPATEMLQIGATIRRVADSKFKKDDEESRGVFAGMIAAATGVAEEIPFVKQTIDAGKALDPRTQGDFISEFVKSRAIPGLSQWTANKLDTDAQGNTIKRKPESFFQHLETGIPGLRQKVPAAKGDSSRVSDEAKEAQMKRARITGEMDKIEQANAKGEDAAALIESLRGKLDRKSEAGNLTNAEAERANKLLGTDEYEGQVEDEPKPDFKKYNKNADGVIEKITTWAEAIGTDPLDAFDKLFKGEYIARLENGTIIVKRMDKSASEAERKRLGGGGKAVKLDHFESLELGGTNAQSNLRLVTTEEWADYTPVENYLATALHNGVITGTEARQMIRDYKNKVIDRQAIVNRVGPPMPASAGDGKPRIPKPTFKIPALRMPSLK